MTAQARARASAPFCAAFTGVLAALVAAGAWIGAALALEHDFSMAAGVVGIAVGYGIRLGGGKRRIYAFKVLALVLTFLAIGYTLMFVWSATNSEIKSAVFASFGMQQPADLYEDETFYGRVTAATDTSVLGDAVGGATDAAVVEDGTDEAAWGAVVDDASLANDWFLKDTGVEYEYVWYDEEEDYIEIILYDEQVMDLANLPYPSTGTVHIYGATGRATIEDGSLEDVFDFTQMEDAYPSAGMMAGGIAALLFVALLAITLGPFVVYFVAIFHAPATLASAAAGLLFAWWVVRVDDRKVEGPFAVG